MNEGALAQRVDCGSTQGWQARLSLGFEERDSRTVLVHRQQEGPLAVQRPFYPERNACHVYLLHPPGGVVGGDSLDIRAEVGVGAVALVTTPGATKFYRSVGPAARQRQTLSVQGGKLEWFPQENILFPGAIADLETAVQLDGSGQFLGWEINCLGRPAIDERFTVGRATFGFALYREGRPLLIERFRIDGASDLDASTGLRGWPVMGTLVATGADGAVVDAARAALAGETDSVFGITCVDEVLVVRYLGSSTQSGRRLFIAVWKAIRPLVHGRSACVPRIWAT